MQNEFSISLLNQKFTGLGEPEKASKPNSFICLHGWLDNAASFSPLAKNLESHFSTISLDLPGHGKAFHLEKIAHYHLLDHISYLEALRKHWGIEKFKFLCHSLGGVIAGLYAGVYPERVDVVYSIEAIGPLSAPEEDCIEWIRRYSDRWQWIHSKQKRRHPSLESCVKARLRNNDISRSAVEILVKRGAVKIDDYYQWRADNRLTIPSSLRMSEKQVKSILENIQCPYHLFVAEKGLDVMNRALKLRSSYIKNLKIHQVPGDHHCHMDYPDKIAKTLIEEEKNRR